MSIFGPMCDFCGKATYKTNFLGDPRPGFTCLNSNCIAKGQNYEEYIALMAAAVKIANELLPKADGGDAPREKRRRD